MVLPSITTTSLGNPGPSNRLIMQPLDQQPAPGTLNYYPTVTTISVDPRKDQDRVFVETFLIDAVSTPNKKGWKVSYDNPADFDRRVLESKNHPLTLFQTNHPTRKGELIWDHPVAPITTLEAAADPVRANIEFQKKYTIGYARHFKKVKDGIWHAVYEIVSPKAKSFFKRAKEKGLKLFTSPYIVRPSTEPSRTNIKEWALIHNAIVSQPAHDETIASIKDVKMKTGDAPIDLASLFASLTAEFEAASMTHEECEFCVETSLEVYADSVITSHDNISDKLTIMAEQASNNTGQQAETVLTATTTNPQQQQTSSTVTTQYPANNTITEVKPVSQGVQDVSNNTQQQEEAKTEQNNTTELDTLKQQIAQLTKQNQALEQKYAFDTRKANVEKLFSPIVSTVYVDQKTGIVDEKAYNDEVTRLTKSNHTFEEIQELVQARFVLAQHQANALKKQEKASLTSQVNEMASFPYTKMSTGNNNAKEAAVIANDSVGINVLRRLQGATL